jgi:hypothetical protein
VALQHFPIPDLILTLFSEEHPGVARGDRQPADLIVHDRDTAAGKVGGPPADWRLTQIQLKMADRDEVIPAGITLFDYVVVGQRAGKGMAEHLLFSNFSQIVEVNWRGGQDGVSTRAERS